MQLTFQAWARCALIRGCTLIRDLIVDKLTNPVLHTEERLEGGCKIPKASPYYLLPHISFLKLRDPVFDLAVSCIQNDLSVKSSYHTLCTGMDSLRYVAFPVL